MSDRPRLTLSQMLANGDLDRLFQQLGSWAAVAKHLGVNDASIRKARRKATERLPEVWDALGEAYQDTEAGDFEDEEATQPNIVIAEGTRPSWQPSDFRNPEVLPYEPPQPKILLLDIETAPAIAYVWRLFDENIGLDQLIAPSRMLCWAAKWYGGGWHVADERGGRRGLLEPLHALLSEADAVVTYNGDRFDLPKINGEFMAEKMEPVPPFPSIDLYRTVKQLGYQSSKLAFVGPHLGVGEKIATEGFKLWADVMSNDERAWSKMLAYNKQDVALLEDLYTRVRPYIRSHPTLHKGAKCCPACGSSTAQHHGWRRTRAFMIERLQCQGCGGWFDGSRQRAA